VAAVLAAAPAALAGLGRCKGALAAGLDADIVVRAGGVRSTGRESHLERAARRARCRERALCKRCGGHRG